MSDLMKKYNDKEFDRIIRRALKTKKNNGTLSHQDLIDIANEIGIEAHVVEAAIEQEKRIGEKERIWKNRIKRKKSGFICHLYSYLFVNSALLITDFFVPGPWWSHWSIIGWGIGLAFHYKAIQFLKRKRNYMQMDFA